MTPQEQQQLNRLLQEGIELAKKLGDTAAEASLTNFNGDLRTAELAVRSLKNEWSEYVNDIKGAREGFTRIVDEIKNMNSGAKMAKSSFSGLASITAKLQSHQENINSLSSKELQSLKSKTSSRFNDLLLAGKLAKD
jgi:multidrug resistance efflux pump